MDNDLSEAEKRAIQWLRDENAIQRNVRELPSGKKEVQELDVSGGLAALLHILRDNQAPIHPSLRQALAHALDPIHFSLLQLVKRPRRTPGRPGNTSSTRGLAKQAYEAKVVPAEVDAEMVRLFSTQLIPAAGMKRKPARKQDAIKNVGAKRKIGRSKIYELESAATNIQRKALKKRDK